MKKVYAIIISLMLLIGASIPVTASGFNMVYSPENIKPGDAFSVTISLDETLTIDEDITCVQGELYYDADVLTYVSHEMSDNYSHYMSANREEKERVQFSYLSMDFSPVEVPAGEIITVVFATNQEVGENEITSMLQLQMKISTKYAETTESNACASVTINSEKVHIEEIESSDEISGEEQKDTLSDSNESESETADKKTAVNETREHVVDDIEDMPAEKSEETKEEEQQLSESDVIITTETNQTIQETRGEDGSRSRNYDLWIILILLIVLLATALYLFFKKRKR